MPRECRASKVSDLIEELKKLPPNATWWGWDDESLIVEDPDDPDHYWYISPDKTVGKA